jgi:sulfide dehydrogenase cytochrome subunit
MDLASFKPKITLMLLAGVAIVSSCKEQFLTDTTATTNTTANARIAATNEDTGRLLASNCFQCHGTNGYGMEHLAGMPATELIEEMNEMKAKIVSKDIMNVHAQAYTTEEIQLIAEFFAKQ